MAQNQELSGEAASLALDLMSASMSANFDAMDRLFEDERQRRRALEVHIDEALQRFEAASGGTVREYEAAVRFLCNLPYGERAQHLAARHAEVTA